MKRIISTVHASTRDMTEDVMEENPSAKFADGRQVFCALSLRVLAIFAAILLVIVSSGVAGTENGSSDFQKDFFVSKGGKLIVSVSVGDIQVRVWDKSQVQMTAQDIGEDADRVETDQSGNIVNVRYRVHGGLWGSSRNLRFIFYVPSNFNLDLSTSGGDVTIEGQLVGDVDLSTSGGDLKIDDVDGKADGKTSGGDIIVHNLEKDATLSTSGGDIRVDHAASDLQVSTSGGDIVVGTVGKDLDASTAGGDISIEKAGGNLRASTSSGDMTIGKIGGNVDISTSGGDILLASGNGHVSANTSGGDIEVMNATGSVDVWSSGGTVKVCLTPKGNQESRIESSGGDVYLYVPSDAKASIRAEVSGSDDNEIVSDFPVVIYDKSHGYGNETGKITLNGGGQKIYLHSSGGNISVKKLSSFSK
jgi:DUF4097 and DUF4098 domain-containing protein YvlB